MYIELTKEDCKQLKKKNFYKDNLIIETKSCDKKIKEKNKINNLVRNLLNPPSYGEHKIYYEDGSLFGIEHYKNYKKHGKMIYFHKNGNKDFDIEFLNGIRDGYYNKYENNEVKISKLYRNGTEVPYIKKSEITQENYLLELYYSSDKKDKYIKVQVVNKVYEGKYTCWWPNGTIKAECHYVNGKIEGESIEYKENGSILRKTNWKNGKKEGLELIYS